MHKVFEKIIEKLELNSFEFGKDIIPVNYVRLNKAIEIVKQEAEKYTSTVHSEEYEKGFEDGAESVRSISQYQDIGWISCSERLPEANQMVLATENDSVILCCYEFIEGHGYCFYGSNGNVIAWQPLQEPYQPKGDE